MSGERMVTGLRAGGRGDGVDAARFTADAEKTAGDDDDTPEQTLSSVVGETETESAVKNFLLRLDKEGESTAVGVVDERPVEERE